MTSQPYSSTLDNNMSLFIELSISIYLYILIALTDFMGENTLREELGWALACLIMFVVAINILVLALKTIV